MLLNLPSMIETLKNSRPVFHSEADFQHALAWQIHLCFPSLNVRLEHPISWDTSDHLDILVGSDQEQIAIELKYKTTMLFASVNGEAFVLKSHSAQDCGRYDYLLDIQRLEKYIADSKSTVRNGYAVLLTNDSMYWNPPRSDTTVDACFRLHQGRNISGTLQWDQRASKGTTATREQPIVLSNSYSLNWLDYSDVTPFMPPDLRNIKMYPKFRYLMVEIA